MMKKNTLIYVLPTTYCVVLICTGAIIGVARNRKKMTPGPRGSINHCAIFRTN